MLHFNIAKKKKNTKEIITQIYLKCYRLKQKSEKKKNQEKDNQQLKLNSKNTTASAFSLSLLHTKQKHVSKKLAFRGIKIIQLLPSLTGKCDVPPHESSLQGNGHKMYCDAH